MKRCRHFILPAVVGALAGIWIEKRTKKIQKKARLEGKHIPYGPYEAVLKRPLDILFAGSALVILSPVMGITALFVKRNLGSPILFTQERPGLNEKIFTIYKFRTMIDEKDSDGNLLPDEKRLTRFGKLLRSTSLDELPELLNILKGDMAVVGPRPQLVKDMLFMTKEQRQRHSVRPGLSGLAQVHGRNAISWEKKLTIDLTYIDNITFINDARIIITTIFKVIQRKNINEKGCEATLDFGDYLLKTGKITETEYQKKQEDAIQLIAVKGNR